MYKSPITIIESTIDSFSKAIIKQKDDAIFAEIQSSFCVDVDRQELIRALKYDRDQYEKGYADGKAGAVAELVRCKDCIHFDKEKALRPGGIWCTYWGTDPDPDDWCCKGERKDNERKAD